MSSILPGTALNTDEDIGSVKVLENASSFSKTFLFDFDKKEFVTDTMNRVMTTEEGKELLRQIVNKTLHDERYKHLIYPDYYGNEIKSLIAAGYHPDVMESELKRVIRESLIYHNKIEDVREFSFMYFGNKMYVEFTVTGTDDVRLVMREEVLF